MNVKPIFKYSADMITKKLWIVALAIILGTTQVVTAHIAEKTRSAKDNAETVQRAAPSGAFDLQRNVVSNIDFYTTNYGIFGYNVLRQVGGTFWPRGKQNQYLFASGAWFAALKRPPGSTELRKRVAITYNPNSGESWMVPGAIEDGDGINNSGDAIQKNRVYFSTDFNIQDGTDIYNPDFPKWPIWDTSESDTLRVNNYYGMYVNNPESRSRTTYRKGPAFISQEDIFSVYKDTDLSRYEGGALARKNEGFPLGLQIEQMIYSWGFGDYADFVFMKYMFIHPKKYTDTLFQCWMAGVLDVDIAPATNSRLGAANDRARYYKEEDSLNLAVQWTNSDRGEANQGFGYLGFNFLESPAVDVDGYLRTDKKQFPVSEQLGMRTMRNWPITVDPLGNEERYNFMSSQDLDGDDGPGDRRLLMATGPFNVKPGDSARIVIGVILATTASGADATGTTEDMAELIRKVRFAQFVYNNQFRAPQAPGIPIIMGYESSGSLFTVPRPGWLPLNNAVAIQWDSTAEISIDTLEAGMDFLGYRIYRARRTDLDTFARDLQLTERKGPLAWKQIAQIPVPPPFLKTSTLTETAKLPIDDLFIADVIKPGQRRFLVGRKPSNALPWAGYWNKLLNARRPNYGLTVNTADSTIDVSKFDKFDSVRFTYFSTRVEELPTVRRVPATQSNPMGLDTAQSKAALDSLIKLILAKRIVNEPFLFRDRELNADGEMTVLRPWEETREVRHDIVAPYIHKITNGRQWYDNGDDNGDGRILWDPNPEKSEKLINNIDYYYAVRAYDEGDYLQDLGSKLTIKGVGLSNTVAAMPLADRPSGDNTVNFTIPPDQAEKLGGIYNIRLLINDQQRFNQMFAGKTLELEFDRTWFGIDHDQDPATTPVGWYGLVMTLRDSATQAMISQWQSNLPPQLCGGAGLNGNFTENALTWVDVNNNKEFLDSATGLMITKVFDPVTGTLIRVDTNSFHMPDNMEKVVRSGSYITSAECFGNKYALGTVGIGFDYAIQQYGGVYRTLPKGDIISGGDPNIYVGAARKSAQVYNDKSNLNRPPAYFEEPYPGWQLSPGVNWDVSYNNGPGIYEITFGEGGTETITTSFSTSTKIGDDSDDGKRATFENVPYLTMHVRNVESFDRSDARPDGTVGSVKVSYPAELKAAQFTMDSIQLRADFPNPELTPVGSYSTAAYGWRNSRYGNFTTATLKYFAADSNSGSPVGTMGRYYLSRNLSTTGKDTLDFTHVITIAGAQFVIDFSRFGSRNAAAGLRVAPVNVPFHGNTASSEKPIPPATDFKPGDKIRLYTFGGAFGFPMDSTKVYAKIGHDSPDISGRPYTESELEQIQVVPNPYYVTHEGMRSPYEGRLYFTRLPRQAKISIYTLSGELVTTYNHDESTSDDPHTFGTYVWDLLSKNRQRVVSQMLIAKIETPDGTSVTKKFTIVLGGARIQTQE